MKKYSKYIIALICMAIVVLRIFFPKLNFDLISVSLIAIATIVMLIKDPENIFNNTKKIKFGSFELELQELNRNAKEIEEKIAAKKPVGLSGPVTRIQNKLDVNKTEILTLTENVEKELREVYHKRLKPEATESISALMLIEKLREGDIVDYETSDIMRKFFNFRNQAVHNDSDISIKELESFREFSSRILAILKLLKKPKGLIHRGLS